MKVLSLSLALLSTATSAFQVPSGTAPLRLPSRSVRFPPRRNIPSPTYEGGATPEEIKDAADKVAPPSSFYELQIASVRAAQDAIRDGYRLLEVEVSFCVMSCCRWVSISFVANANALWRM